MQNPLLKTDTFPAFHDIKPEHIEPAVDETTKNNLEKISALISENKNFTWDNLIYPLELLGETLHKCWSPVNHLNSVANNEDLRVAYNACLPKLTAYATEIQQNEKLYYAFKQLFESPEYDQLNFAQQKLIQNQLRDFELSGVHLPPTEKKQFAEIQTQLSQLQTKFEENILDATGNWTKHITNEKLLEGIPPHALAAAKNAAEEKNLSGWLLTLQAPCYIPIISYAKNRALREEMYFAYVTRASDQSAQENKFDNTNVLLEILKLRHEMSGLLNKKNYAELSLATKMAKKPSDVLDFINNLAQHLIPQAKKELAELTAYAKNEDDITELKSWDTAYYSEKLCEKNYGFNDEMLRPYFPENKVVSGLFHLVHRLYGLQIQEIKNISLWHPDVRFFEIKNPQGETYGHFYLDLYARAHKREGAWMDHYSDRFKLNNGMLQTPVAYLTCNLTPPRDSKPALFTHDEVITLFHEFGHGLHHLLTKIEYPSVAGINGVAWDAVELPSQFMEFFVWEEEVLNNLSGHYETGEPLPKEYIAQLRAAKNFNVGIRLLRQIEFTLFDFRLHLEFDPLKGAEQVQQILNDIRSVTAMISPPNYNRFQNTFAHIFAGSYAAAYYSYLWAEMLASDAYAKFEETGIFNHDTGKSFLDNILSMGGSKDALDLFIAFRGRQPSIEALLKHNGIE